MSHTHCILCGREYPTGLHILGCFLCFPCEKALLDPVHVRSLSPRKRRRLAQWATPCLLRSRKVLYKSL